MIIVITSFAVAVSIAAVLLFLGALMSPETVFVNVCIQLIVANLNFKAPNRLLLPLILLVIATATFSEGKSSVLIWAQTRLGRAILVLIFVFRFTKKFCISIIQRFLFEIAGRSLREFQ